MSVGDRIAFGSGVFLIIFGILVGFSWPVIFNHISKQKLTLSPSSETFKLWVKTPLPMYLEVYLFNWTNSEEFMKNKTVKPQFEEIGPFVFEEVHQRVDINWNKNSSVSYNQTRIWSYVPQESLELSTPICNLNVIATAITRMAEGYSNFIKIILDIMNYFYKEKLLITKPANEWLFDGIDDKLLDLVKKYINIPSDKFGWFYGRNLSSSYDGRFSINTGEDNIFSLGALEQWNYVNKTGFYEGECGTVRGSSGELFSPVKDWQDDLTIFVTDFCSPLTLKYSGLKSVEGLEGYHYVGDESVFDNGTSSSRAKCFCTGKCTPSGVRNVTACRQIPLFISFPHFYLADQTYAEAVIGMNPNKSKHEFYLDIDPLTGIPLEVRAQLQLNVLLQPLKEFPMFKNVPKVYIPMMWFRQRAKVTPDIASRGKTLQVFSKLGLGVAVAVSLAGVLVILVRLCLVTVYSRRKNFELLINSKEAKEEDQQIGYSEDER